jgi:protein-tyrosine phosphatase
MKVLFVCLGNICRSPLGEGVFRHLAEDRGLEAEVDSCGTGGWHVGEAPDSRSVEVARGAGIDISRQRARQLSRRDLEEFDHIFAMDRSNLAGIEGLRTPDSTAEISLLLDYHPESPGPDVPDPYYGGAGGFDRVLQLVMDACNGFLEQSGHPR